MQTGSGKTYSMGTGLEAEQSALQASLSDTVGILPRSVHHLFTGIERLRDEAVRSGRAPPEFRVQAQFLELYNEEIIDLLEPAHRVSDLAVQSVVMKKRLAAKNTNKKKTGSEIGHEDPRGPGRRHLRGRGDVAQRRLGRRGHAVPAHGRLGAHHGLDADERPVVAQPRHLHAAHMPATAGPHPGPPSRSLFSCSNLPRSYSGPRVHTLAILPIRRTLHQV